MGYIKYGSLAAAVAIGAVGILIFFTPAKESIFDAVENSFSAPAGSAPVTTGDLTNNSISTTTKCSIYLEKNVNGNRTVINQQGECPAKEGDVCDARLGGMIQTTPKSVRVGERLKIFSCSSDGHWHISSPRFIDY